MKRVEVLNSHVTTTRRVGIVGYGKVGSFLVEKIIEHQNHAVKTSSVPRMVLAFVVDLFDPKAVEKSTSIPEDCKSYTLDNFFDRYRADLVVEVAHPDISKRYGAKILQSSDFLIASTTAFADKETEKSLQDAVATNPLARGIYLTVGALYGAFDLKKMSDAGQLRRLQVTMTKHPLSLYPEPGTPEHAANEAAKIHDGPVVLYKGPIRRLAAVCPRNVNTLCTAALAAIKTTGMDHTEGVLVADRSLMDMIIEVKAEGPARPKDGGPGLRIDVTRRNPSEPGEVTGMATFQSFYASLLRVASSPSQGRGVHLA